MELHKTIGTLARQSSLSDPHSPVWVPGLSYPVQYVVRQTRSMSSQLDDSCHGNDTLQLIVNIPLSKLPPPTPSTPARRSLLPAASTIKGLLKPLDFFLPDNVFSKEKLTKLKEVERLKKTVNMCSVADNQDHTHLVPLATPTSVPIGLCPTRLSCECYCHDNQYSQQFRWANNNRELSYLSAVNTTANGQLVMVTAADNCNLAMYQEDKLLYTIDAPLESPPLALKLLKIGTSLFLIHVSIKQFHLWELSRHSPPLLLIKEEMDHSSNDIDPASLYPICIESHPLSDSVIYISLLAPPCDCNLRLVRLSHSCCTNDTNKQWQVISCTSYSNTVKLSTICAVSGNAKLLLGISIDGPMRLLLYNVEMGVVTDSVPLTCPQPTLPVKPVKPVILIGATTGTSSTASRLPDNVILVVLCVYGRVWSGVAGWLVAWDTTAKQSYWLLSYKHSPALLQNGCEVVSWCYHYSQFSLLFSSNCISTWNTDKPHPLRHASVN